MAILGIIVGMFVLAGTVLCLANASMTRRDKVSGTFHSEQGAARFVAVRSSVQTADAHRHNLLDACRGLFSTGAWLPPPPAATVT